MADGRIPQNQEAEVSVLGSILLAGTSARDVLDTLATEEALRSADFYRPRHGTIFAAIAALGIRNEPIDVLTVCAELDRAGHLMEVGGAEYVHSLPNLVPAAANARAYASIVRRMAWLRARLDVTRRMQECILLEDLDGLAVAEAELSELGEPIARHRPTLEQRQQEIAEHVQRGELDLPQWPWTTLNDLTGGIWPGHFTVVGGITRHGKSVVVDQVLEHFMRQRPDGRAALYPTEGGTLERDARTIARTSDLPLKRVLHAKVGAGEMPRFIKAVERLPHYDIVPVGSMTARDLAREMHRQRLQLMVIDLFNGLPGSSKVEEIDDNVRVLAAAAAETGCHVIATNHFNRNRLMGAYPPEPALGDLRGSGQLGDLATNVLLIYRREQLVDRAGVQTPTGRPGNEAYIEAAKLKNGIEGRVDLYFNGGRMRFTELDTRHSDLARDAA